jgi:asparagine synthase (glutamine-hydrolysing)
LYYSIGPAGEIRFASEMKSLIGSAGTPDLCTVNAIMLGLGGTWGEPTVFQGVKHVCAGEWVRFDKEGRRSAACFFHINDFVDKELYEEQARYTPEQAVQKVHDELVKSVEMQLVSDAPVAVLASGGVDSSIVAAIASRKYENLVLYHADVQHASEVDAARTLARELGLELRTTVVSDQDALDTLAKVTYHYEQPLLYHGGSCIPFYLVSKLVGNDGVKVVLTGEGSDEYFIGYQNHVM